MCDEGVMGNSIGMAHAPPPLQGTVPEESGGGGKLPSARGNA
jgi:hypothetical protein